MGYCEDLSLGEFIFGKCGILGHFGTFPLLL